MSGASDLLKNITGGSAGPSTATGGYNSGTAYNSSPYDGSNWTVATGSGKASASNIPWALIAVAAVIGMVVLRKGR